MLMKRLFCLLLCLLLLPVPFSPARAEEAAYIPGQISAQLLRNAVLSGNMLCADISLTLDLNTDMFGLSEEEAAAADMICEVLRDTHLTVGAARIPDGAALLLRGTYGADSASADVILSLMRDGASVETSLLPGERIAISWEDVLTLSGLDDATSAIILSLRDTDPEELMQLAVQAFELGKNTIAMTAAPYIRLISDFIAAQPVEFRQDVAAEGYFPAVAQESILIITQKALGELLVSLAGQLEQDAILSAALDTALSAVMNDPSFNTAALCAFAREIAADMTDEQYPFCLITGYDAGQTPLYYSLCTSDADGTSYALNLINMQAKVGEEETGLLLQAFASDEQNYSGMTATFFSVCDPFDENIRTIGAAAEIQMNNTNVFSGEYVMDTEPIPTEDGHTAYDTLQEFSAEMLAYENVLSLSGTLHTEQGEKDGGEYVITESSTHGHLGEVLITETNSKTDFSIAPGAEGPEGAFHEQYAAPQQGVNDAQIACSFYTLPYAPDADAAVLDLGSADTAALSALIQRLKENAIPLLSNWARQLPEVLRHELSVLLKEPAGQESTL